MSNETKNHVTFAAQKSFYCIAFDHMVFFVTYSDATIYFHSRFYSGHFF